ncbi:Inositol-pentakisphosphate 2-kinase [Varanus komodoensis]|nr:Inositol-pentakisphosphate 2-kinase [Varanus komodoensis]
MMKPRMFKKLKLIIGLNGRNFMREIAECPCLNCSILLLILGLFESGAVFLCLYIIIIIIIDPSMMMMIMHLYITFLPLAGNPRQLLYEVVQLPLDFVKQLCLKIQSERPESRCDKDMDTFSGYAMCLPNLTRLHFVEHRPIICIEIKMDSFAFWLECFGGGWKEAEWFLDNLHLGPSGLHACPSTELPLFHLSQVTLSLRGLSM